MKSARGARLAVWWVIVAAIVDDVRGPLGSPNSSSFFASAAMMAEILDDKNTNRVYKKLARAHYDLLRGENKVAQRQLAQVENLCPGYNGTSLNLRPETLGRYHVRLPDAATGCGSFLNQLIYWEYRKCMECAVNAEEKAPSSSFFSSFFLMSCVVILSLGLGFAHLHHGQTQRTAAAAVQEEILLHGKKTPSPTTTTTSEKSWKKKIEAVRLERDRVAGELDECRRGADELLRAAEESHKVEVARLRKRAVEDNKAKKGAVLVPPPPPPPPPQHHHHHHHLLSATGDNNNNKPKNPAATQTPAQSNVVEDQLRRELASLQQEYVAAGRRLLASDASNQDLKQALAAAAASKLSSEGELAAANRQAGKAEASNRDLLGKLAHREEEKVLVALSGEGELAAANRQTGKAEARFRTLRSESQREEAALRAELDRLKKHAEESSNFVVALKMENDDLRAISESLKAQISHLQTTAKQQPPPSNFDPMMSFRQRTMNTTAPETEQQQQRHLAVARPQQQPTTTTRPAGPPGLLSLPMSLPAARRTPPPKTFSLIVDGVNVLAGAKLYLEAIDEGLEREMVRLVDEWIQRTNRGERLGRNNSGRVSQQAGALRRDFQAGPRFDDYRAKRIITEGERLDDGSVFKPEPMPQVALALRDALAKRRIVPADDVPDIFLANNYEPGQYTLNHIDSEYIQRPLIVTTLLSTGVMVLGTQLTRDNTANNKGGTAFKAKSNRHHALTIQLPPRSAFVLTGVAADTIQHAINPADDRRISILLRKTHLQKGNTLIDHTGFNLPNHLQRRQQDTTQPITTTAEAQRPPTFADFTALKEPSFYKPF